MYFDRTEPTDNNNNYHTGNALLLLDSYFQLLQHTLLPRESNLKKLAKDIYHAPFVVLAHDVAADPTFFYANLKAQQLFKMTWAEMVCLPSRLSAEPVARAGYIRSDARRTFTGVCDYRQQRSGYHTACDYVYRRPRRQCHRAP